MSPIDSKPHRRLRLVLRDHRVLDARAQVPAGHDLATYLATRNRYINLVDVDWVGTGERVPHMALKVETILWASTAEDSLPLTRTIAAAETRRVQVELEGGYLIAAGLLLVQGQRLSDYLQAAPSFVPLRDAELRPRQKQLGDVVVSQDAIQSVRELPAEASPPDEAGSDPGREPESGTDA